MTLGVTDNGCAAGCYTVQYAIRMSGWHGVITLLQLLHAIEIINRRLRVVLVCITTWPLSPSMQAPSPPRRIPKENILQRRSVSVLKR